MRELEESRAYSGAPGLLDSINNNGVALHRLGGEEYASTPLRHKCFIDVAWELGKAQGLTEKHGVKLMHCG